MGFTPTSRAVTREPSTICAATSTNAAADTSPGIVMSNAGMRRSQPEGSIATTEPTARNGQPSDESIRSVWSRDTEGSRRRVDAIGVEPGQQDGALDLRAGDGTVVLERGEDTALGQGTHDERRQDVVLRRVLAPFDDRATKAKGAGDAHHRTAGERLVADQRGAEVGGGEGAAEQAHRRTGVAAVQIAGGRLQAAQPLAVHHELGRRGLIDDDPHRAQRVRRRDVVLTVGEAGDVRVALAERPEQERPVADALVGGDGDAAGEGSRGGVDDERGHRSPTLSPQGAGYDPSTLKYLVIRLISSNAMTSGRSVKCPPIST